MSSIRISAKETYGPLIPSGKVNIVLSLEPLETLRILKKYGNPGVKCITNTHPNFPIGSILSEKSKYPDQNELRQAIKSLSKKAWFIDAAAIASKLGAPIVTNIVMMGALLGTGLLEIERKDIKDEMKSAFPADKIALNLKALGAGINAIR
jgi:indolepyruvate ferredoxin oxidoreductase beta subunit